MTVNHRQSLYPIRLALLLTPRDYTLSEAPQTGSIHRLPPRVHHHRAPPEGARRVRRVVKMAMLYL